MLHSKWHFKVRVETDNCEYGTYRARFFIEGRVVGCCYYSDKNATDAYKRLDKDATRFLYEYYDDFVSQIRGG